MQFVQRRAQPVQDLGRRGVGEITRLGGHREVAKLEIGAAHRSGFRRIERLGADGKDAKTGRAHQALLAAGHGQIDAPIIHAKVDGADRGHAVDEQHRAVVGSVQRAADTGDVAGHAGRGLVVGDEDGLDLTLAVSGQFRGEFGDRGPCPPGDVDHLDLQPQTGGHFDPERRKLAMPRHQHAVTGVQRVGDCRLPGAGAGTGIQDHAATLRAENALEIGEDAKGKRAEQWATLVFHGDIHRPAHGFGHIRGAGNEEVVDTVAHGFLRFGTPPLHRWRDVQRQSGLRCERENLQIVISVIL